MLLFGLFLFACIINNFHSSLTTTCLPVAIIERSCVELNSAAYVLACTCVLVPVLIPTSCAGRPCSGGRNCSGRAQGWAMHGCVLFYYNKTCITHRCTYKCAVQTNCTRLTLCYCWHHSAWCLLFAIIASSMTWMLTQEWRVSSQLQMSECQTLCNAFNKCSWTGTVSAWPIDIGLCPNHTALHVSAVSDVCMLFPMI